METLTTYMNENQKRYLNIVRNDRTSKRMMFRNAEKKLRKFQHDYDGDVKLGYTGGRYLQAIKVEGDVWYITLEDDYIKCISSYLIAALSVDQMIKRYKKHKKNNG